MLKKFFAICAALMIAPAAYATCTTHTYFINGKVIICTICCYGDNCTTNCY